MVGSVSHYPEFSVSSAPKEFGWFCEVYETVGHKCTMINFVYNVLGRELS